MKHLPRWAKIGLWNADGSMSIPCVDCWDELVINPNTGEKRGVVDGFKPHFDLQFVPDNDGITKIICREIERDYHLDGLNIPDGGIILDIGAHKGIVSCYLAKTYPRALVKAYEPVYENIIDLRRNVKLNNLSNIMDFCLAITKDGRWLRMTKNIDNSGGANIYMPGDMKKESKTMRDLFNEFFWDHPDTGNISLLKIDCEGAEYEILDTPLLSRIDHLRGEFHRCPQGNPEELLARVKAVIPDTIVTIAG